MSECAISCVAQYQNLVIGGVTNSMSVYQNSQCSSFVDDSLVICWLHFTLLRKSTAESWACILSLGGITGAEESTTGITLNVVIRRMNDRFGARGKPKKKV